MMQVMTRAEARYGSAYYLCGTDGVHPHRNGHLVMAYAFLKALGCDGNIGTISVDLANNSATATPGHEILSAADGRVQIKSSRYPFCFWGDPASPDSTTGVLEFLPFNDDLNRFMLVVNHASADKLRVTWGEQSKIFTADELAKGINLAAEFLDNPFLKSFQSIEQRISEKQSKQINLYHNIMDNFHFYKDYIPQEQPQIEKMRDELLEWDRQTSDAVSAEVVPIVHTISIQTTK